MNLTELAYKYQKLLFFIIVIFTIYGAYSYFTLPAQEDPSITIREAVVSTATLVCRLIGLNYWSPKS